MATFLSLATLRLRSGQASLLALDDAIRWPKVVAHVHAHLVGREIADVSHGGFDGVVATEKVAESSRFGRTLHND